MAHHLRSVHDLAEGDARGIVDADMNELPAAAPRGGMALPIKSERGGQSA
jgi:hypothetical protein